MVATAWCLHAVAMASARMRRFEVEGSRCAGANGNGSATEQHTAPALALLQAAGACGLGRAFTPELNLGCPPPPPPPPLPMLSSPVLQCLGRHSRRPPPPPGTGAAA